MQNLLTDFQAWRTGVQATFQQLSKNPATSKQDVLRTWLNRMVDHMEQCIAETMDKASAEQLTDRDEENFYRLLGAYRGISEALVDFTETAGVIDWAPWREERFV